MSPRSTLMLAGLCVAMSVAPSFAQTEGHRIGGKAVPDDQLVEVQAQCDAMRKGDEQSPVVDAASDQPTDAQAAAAASNASVSTADDLWIDNGARIDTSKLSIERCDEGNFGLTPQ